MLVRVDGDVVRVAHSDGTVDKQTTFDKARGRGNFWQPHGEKNILALSKTSLARCRTGPSLPEENHVCAPGITEVSSAPTLRIAFARSTSEVVPCTIKSYLPALSARS